MSPGPWAKPRPEIKSQTLPWVLPVLGGAPGATGTISVVWAVPRSTELSGMGGSPDKKGRGPGARVSWGLMDGCSGCLVTLGGASTLFIGVSSASRAPDGRAGYVLEVPLVCLAQEQKRVKDDGPGRTGCWLAGGCPAEQGGGRGAWRSPLDQEGVTGAKSLRQLDTWRVEQPWGGFTWDTEMVLG